MQHGRLTTLAACAALGVASAPPTPALAAGLAGPALQDNSDVAPPGAAAFAVKGGVRDLLTAPLVDRDDTGTLWARTRDLRVAFDGDSTTVYPIIGSRSPREWPVKLTLAGVTLGGEALELGPQLAPELVVASDSAASDSDSATSVVVRHGALHEVHHLTLGGVEQTFVFEALPAAEGDLVVALTVETDLLIEHAADGGALRFVHGAFGHLDYGAAFVLDANGVQAAIERVWTGSHIELRVPAAFLADAVMPMTIDPLLSWFSNGFGVSDDARPDIVYCGRTDEYLVCWEEYTSAANSDVYLTKWAADVQTQGPAIGLEMGNDTWVGPRIAYSYAADRALVVANANPVPMGLPTSAVVGRLVDVTAFAPVGGTLLYSSIGNSKFGADVGGSARAALAEGNFCVVWSEQVGPGDHDVRYKVVAPDGTQVTAIINVDNSNEDDVTPAIAKALGGGPATDLAWTIVWIRDTNEDGVGRVFARRIASNGALGAGNLVVDGADNCANPVVSARLDNALDGSPDRPSIVAFERLRPSTLVPGSLEGDIQLKVVRDNLAGPLSSVTLMEDFDAALDQRRPAITTNGRGFCVAYIEERYDAPAGGDWNVHMTTGALTVELGNVFAALVERHQGMATTTLPELPVRLTMQREGHPLNLTELGAAIWTRVSPGNGFGFGGVHGVTFRHRAALLVGPKPVGRQYCDAEPNSVNQFGGRRSSWLRILGNQSTGTLHTAECIDMPGNSFAYLNASQATGNVLFPGGSQGRLCISGSIGRYVDQIVSSGASSSVSVTIDPSALPQPGGPIAAAAGETWYFQLWHRDSVGGVATSNFSNACALHFRN